MPVTDGLDELYQEVILDHYRKPHHQGLLDNPQLQSEGFNPFCGDQVILNLTLNDAGRIAEVSFQGQGCSISQASASILTDHLEGKSLDEAEDLVTTFKGIMSGNQIPEDQEETMGDIVVLQGVRQFPIRIKCALLSYTTLQDAIANYRESIDGD